MRSIEAPIGRTTYLENGARVLTNVVDIRGSISPPGKVADHEARHSFVGLSKLKRATIKPGPGYLGLTELSEFDATAAAASHANEGNADDIRKIKAAGHDVGSATSAAKDRMSGNEDIIYEIASRLEEKKELSGDKIRSIAKQVERRRKFDVVEVSVISPDGSKNEFQTEIEKKGTVVLVNFGNSDLSRDKSKQESQSGTEDDGVVVQVDFTNKKLVDAEDSQLAA